MSPFRVRQARFQANWPEAHPGPTPTSSSSQLTHMQLHGTVNDKRLGQLCSSSKSCCEAPNRATGTNTGAAPGRLRACDWKAGIMLQSAQTRSLKASEATNELASACAAMCQNRDGMRPLPTIALLLGTVVRLSTHLSQPQLEEEHSIDALITTGSAAGQTCCPCGTALLLAAILLLCPSTKPCPQPGLRR